MLKIGIIGLGSIAEKAYLPVISKRKVEIHLLARNEARLQQIAEQYRFKNVHQNIDTMIGAGIDGAFVHTSTVSHYPIVEQLLSSNIHVYVDKPLTYDFASTEKLVTLAAQKKLLLHVGFNRRYAPAYLPLRSAPAKQGRQLEGLHDTNMIIMQKNRRSLPGDVRTFVFDDFIHVIDTLLFLFGHPVEKMIVTGSKKDSMLHHVVVHLLAGDGTTAIGIMNRDSGTVEEKLEVFTPEEKWVVHNLVDTVIHKDGREVRLRTNDWETTLQKRGFDQIIDNFLLAMEAPFEVSQKTGSKILLTHKICEQVVEELSALQ